MDRETTPHVLSLAALTVAAVLLLPGCIDTAEEGLSPDIDMKAVDSWTQETGPDGREPMTGKIWTYVRVKVTSHNDEMDVYLSPSHFYGYTDTGDRIWAYGVDEGGNMTIAPGETEEIEVIFETGKGERIDRIEYTMRVGRPIIFDVPGHFVS